MVDPTAPSLHAVRLGPTGTYEVNADGSGDGAFDDTEQPFPVPVSLRHLAAGAIAVTCAHQRASVRSRNHRWRDRRHR